MANLLVLCRCWCCGCVCEGAGLRLGNLCVGAGLSLEAVQELFRARHAQSRAAAAERL